MEAIGNFFRTLVKIIVGGLAFSAVTCISVMTAGNHGDSNAQQIGAGVNGFIVFLIWVVCVFLIVKGHPIIASIGSFAFYIGAHMMKFGEDKVVSDFNSAVAGVIVLGIFAFFGLGMFKKWEQESNDREERKEHARKSGKACCPYCGRTSIQYYALGIPYEDSWDDRINDWTIGYSSDHYKCLGCGHEW